MVCFQFLFALWFCPSFGPETRRLKPECIASGATSAHLLVMPLEIGNDQQRVDESRSNQDRIDLVSCPDFAIR